MTWSDQIRAVLNATCRTNRDAHATPGNRAIKTGARCTSSSTRSFTLGASARRAIAASWRPKPPVSGQAISSTADSSLTSPGASLASSDASKPDGSAPRLLGQFLTGIEAKERADRLADGDTLTAAPLRVVSNGRRTQVRDLLTACALSNLNVDSAVTTLRAVEGSQYAVTAIDPWWTMPGHFAKAEH